MPLVSFYTSWKYKKTTDFLMFSRGIERDRGIKWVKRLVRRTQAFLSRHRLLVINAGANDLRQNVPENVSKEITDQATSNKTNDNTVIVPGLTAQYGIFNAKAEKVNRLPKKMTSA